MAGKLNIFNFGDQGVDIVKSPLHILDGAWTLAQNAEFCLQGGQGGIKKRGGLAKFNAVALAGAVQALGVAPFPYPGTIDLMVALNAGETNTWDKSPDGTTYTGLTSAQLERGAGIDKTPTALSSISCGGRCASFNSRFFYPGDSFVQYPTGGHTAPPIVVWNGTSYAELLRIPSNPTATAGSHPIWISDLWMADNQIYLAVYDPGGVAPNHKGRVLQFDPTAGTLTTIGNRFGNGTGENAAGFPFCMTSYLGSLYAGTYGISGNNQGKVYRIIPGLEETWTLDLTATLHNGYYMSLCPYQGQLYAATDADSSGTAIVQVRTSVGVWSTSLTAPAANSNYFCSLIVFNNLLFCAYYKTSSGVCLIKKYDGSSWTTDLDVGATYVASRPPGIPFVFRGALYWPFLGSESSASSTAGFLLKRDNAGVWTQPLNLKGIRGCLGQYVPVS